jgi:hypothetical protein
VRADGTGGWRGVRSGPEIALGGLLLGGTKPCPAVPGPGPRRHAGRSGGLIQFFLDSCLRHGTIWGREAPQLGPGVVASTKELRANADECLDWARTARTERERQIFLQMARAWLEAATWREGASQIAQASGGCDDQNLAQSGKGSVGAAP